MCWGQCKFHHFDMKMKHIESKLLYLLNCCCQYCRGNQCLLPTWNNWQEDKNYFLQNSARCRNSNFHWRMELFLSIHCHPGSWIQYEMKIRIRIRTRIIINNNNNNNNNKNISGLNCICGWKSSFTFVLSLKNLWIQLEWFRKTDYDLNY